MALVVENTGARVSGPNGLVRSRSAQPAIRSITTSPSTAGGEAGAELLVRGEIGGEGVADGREPVGAEALDAQRVGHGQASRSIRTLGEATLIRAPMATIGISDAFQIAAAATVSATPPTARARA